MNRIEATIARYSGRFLEPRDGIVVTCPLHGNLGRSSPGGELFCPTCMEWFSAMPSDQPLAGKRLEKKQAALQAKIARRGRTRKRRSRPEDPSTIDAEALRKRIAARHRPEDD